MCKVNNPQQTFEKTTTNKKRMVYITCFTLKDENIHAACLWEFVYAMSFFFLSRFLIYFLLAIVTKRYVLDVAGVLNSLQYVPTGH